MKTLTSICLLMMAFSSASILGQSDAGPKTIPGVQEKFGDAYQNKTLSSLDGKQLMPGSIKLVVEHSIAEGKDGNGLIESKTFASFAALDKWLKRREREDGSPFRQLRPLIKCSKGRCSYNFDGGILHNQLYLKGLSYVVQHGRAKITRIHLLDGD